MKGFTLKWNGKTISGVVRNACSGIIISNKEILFPKVCLR